MASDIESAQSALNVAKQSHRNDPDVVLSNLHGRLAQANTDSAAGKFHDGGEVPEDGNYALEAGEHVLTADQSDKIAPTVPEDSLEAAFVKLGGKKVRGATPKSATEPEPEKFASVGGKFVGKISAAVPSSAKE